MRKRWYIAGRQLVDTEGSGRRSGRDSRQERSQGRLSEDCGDDYVGGEWESEVDA